MTGKIINNKWICSRCEKPNGIRKSKQDLEYMNRKIIRKCKCGRVHFIKIDNSYNIISHYSANLRCSRGTPIKWQSDTDK